jgi:hypothetical protein
MRLMRIACWINETTDTHSEYVILTAFPREQWFGKSAWILHQYVHCRLVILYIYCMITRSYCGSDLPLRAYGGFCLIITVRTSDDPP